MKLINIYVIYSCLGFTMIKRNMVAIHDRVIEMDNKVAIFTGDRGAGKSILLIVHVDYVLDLKY